MSKLDQKTDIAAVERFRKALGDARGREDSDPNPLLAWREELRAGLNFEAELIPLKDVGKWGADPATGNIVHDSGRFFAIQGVRTRAGSLREVSEWDQPIFTQKDGGVLALFAAEMDGGPKFLLNAKAEPGNIGDLQLAASLECTWSNLERAHDGKTPPLFEALNDETPCDLVYQAEHNEEGGRFWKKSNVNCVLYFENPGWFEGRIDRYYGWATMSQLKNLALVDNVLSPFVKTIISPF